MVYFVWGGFSVIESTLKFFFVLHFLLPWVGAGLVVFHLIFLHYTGRSSVLYCHGDYDKVMFFPYYWYKDALDIVVVVFFFVFMLLYPFVLGDNEMFVEHDPLVRPVHIAPE